MKRAEGFVPHAAQVAAALSAAVTTTKQQETASNSQGGASPKEETSLFPNRSSGEGVWGRGGFSERSPSPPRPLSPEERLAFVLVASSELVPPESWARLQ